MSRSAPASRTTAAKADAVGLGDRDLDVFDRLDDRCEGGGRRSAIKKAGVVERREEAGERLCECLPAPLIEPVARGLLDPLASKLRERPRHRGEWRPTRTIA